MKHYKGFDRQTEADVNGDINLLEDFEGRTWGELKGTFSENTWKLGYTSSGVILSLQKDTAYSNIGGCHGVIEIAELPEGFSREEGPKWYFNTETNTVERDPLAYAYLKDKKIRTAVQKIQEHELMESMRPQAMMRMMARSEPSGSALWMNYLFDLQMVDTSLMEDIKWPEKPES